MNPVTIIQDPAKNTAYREAQPGLAGRRDYEVGILIADGAFERLVPERYVGEGSFKFAPQLHMGELEWHYVSRQPVQSVGRFRLAQAIRSPAPTSPLRPQ